MGDDIVIRLLRRVRLEHPQTPEVVWQRLERQMRLDEGGEKHYVLKAAAKGKACLLAERLAAGASVSEAARAIGVSRWTGYRLKRWVTAF